MSSSETAWQALQDALAVSTPLCVGDSRFTSESNEHDATLRKICARCPIQQQCINYARNAPRNGVWGLYGGVVRRTQPQVKERRAAIRQ
ncbi:WhiB family transcriptional regulator [Microbacterium sp. TWP3-1-2b2]|uniref:WhiB family transcriptional regulator n=1 Tax=Microbacterium sp. TWP3-1-2b2 TaxID=2804651 RepID=UPI003CF8BEBA